MLGQKRKANSAADHREKQLKTKKWKGKEQNEGGNKRFAKQANESKKSYDRNLDNKSQNRTGKGKFDSSQARKRKFNDDDRTKDFVKKRKSPETGEHDKGNAEKSQLLYVCYITFPGYETACALIEISC